MNLGEMYRKAAERCVSEHVVIDDRPGGAVHRWVKRNVQHRESTAFFIVMGIVQEMAAITREPIPPTFCKGQMALFDNRPLVRFR